MTGARGLATCLLLLAAMRPAVADRASAESAIAEGREFLKQKDFERAVGAMDRAVAAEPGWAVPWVERAFAKAQCELTVSALEDLGRALAIEPANPAYLNLRARIFMDLDRWTESAEQSAAVLKGNADDPYALSLHGRALVMSGDVDGGLGEMRRAVEMQGARFLPDYASSLLVRADWAGAAKAAEEAIGAGAPSASPYLDRALALVELGRWDDAAKAIAEAERAIPGTVGLYLAKAGLHGTPGAGRHHNYAEALRRLEDAAGTSQLSMVVNTYARILFLNGHVHECLELLSTKGRRGNFETLFWLGATYWKLGQFPEAKLLLSDARRLNPYLAEHAKRVEGLGDFVASIDRELAGESKQGDRERLGHELATHLLTVAEIETLVRRYQFSRAVAEYENLLGALKSDVRRAEVETRLPEVKGMAGAHAKLVAAVNKGAKPKTRVGKTELTIVKATEPVFEFSIAGGEGKFPWAYLDTEVYCALATAQPPAPDELFGLGCLAWDAGQRPLAVKLFEEAAKKKPALKKNLAAFVARRRGIPAPDGGFTLHRGAYVTAEEKTNLEKGFVAFEGRWVTPKDREMLAKGMQLVDGKWTAAADAELLRRGYRKVDGKWMSAEDVAALRSAWANAWVEETAHFTIRTNEAEGFAKDLAVLAEAAYGEFRGFYGGAEPKEKMTLYAFRAYEDYRRHCVEVKAEDHLNAAGFARSDSNVVAGWNKTSNRQQFLQTMVHEAAHLYYFRTSAAARPPSWYAEGMATYFEGFFWDGKGYRFNHLSESRLPFARDAMKGGRHIPLKDLLAGDALALINSDSQKALLFYAECWALNFYLSQTDYRPWKEAYAEYRKAVDTGKAGPLEKFFPDLGKLEEDWVRFVTGL
ncbi:MAG: DUF1570 domain-containing protein [Planctomycetes bacterium]|nr:DUF1570 domain-containing protein [Planctomycetota bacterium]